MTIKQIAEILDAKILCGGNRLEETCEKAFASDLMSDVLTIGDENVLILTGLCNPQTIRTCEMGNLNIVVLVRKKKATPEMIEMAAGEDMVLMECEYSMFKACGLLYDAGIKPLF